MKEKPLWAFLPRRGMQVGFKRRLSICHVKYVQI
jgi:hypothetical protein